MSLTTHPSVFDQIRDPDLREIGWQRFQSKYRPPIYRWCAAGGLQPADAEDVTQAVLIKLIEWLPGFEYDHQKGRFRSYLSTVVRTTIVDFFRARPANRTVYDSALLERVEDLAGGLEAEAFGDPTLIAVAEHVRGLVEPHTWEAFIRYGVENQQPRDVADALGMTVGAVYQAKVRIRQLATTEYTKRLTHSEG